MYYEMLEKVKRMSWTDAFHDMCNGLIVRTQPDRTHLQEVLQLKQEAKETGDVKQLEFALAMLPQDDSHMYTSLYQNALLASMYNASLPSDPLFSNTEFRIANKSYDFCDVFQVEIDTKDVMAYSKKPHSPSSGKQRVWAVTKDSSVYQDGVIDYYEGMKDVLQNTVDIDKPDKDNLLNFTEIVSPILSLQDLTNNGYFQQIMGEYMSVKHMLRYWNCNRTSNHVHMSYDDPLFHANKPAIMVKLCMAWLYFEPVIMLLMGHWRRDNKYCEPMRHKMKLKLTTKVPEFFMQMTSENYMDYLDALLEGIDMRNDPQQHVINALIHFFQGSMDDTSTRYSALNLMNLWKGGIQTVECRIKQGSSDVEENMMYMKFLADFVHNVLDRDDVAKQYGPIFKARTWSTMDILSSNNWAHSTRVSLDKRQKMIVDAVFKELMTYITDTEVKAYFSKVYQKVSSIQGGGVIKTTMTPRRSKKEEPNTIEWTSWGVVDYRAVCAEAAKDPAVQQIKQNMKKYKGWIFRPMAEEQTQNYPPRNALHMVSHGQTVSVYGGKMKKKESRKK